MNGINPSDGRHGGENRNTESGFYYMMILFTPLLLRCPPFRRWYGRMPIFTRIKRDDGWKHLEELRGQFYGQMYKINPEIISRFLIKSTPTIISVEGTYFKVQQFAQADVREYTRINQQSEKEAAQ